MSRPKENSIKADSDSEQPPVASAHGSMMFSLIETQLGRSERGRRYIPPEQLARALKENAGKPLPPIINDYLCDFLEGKIKAPAGRPSASQAPAIKQIQRHLISPYYERYLAWLQKRKRTKGLEGWPAIKDADWWQGPPNERAARMRSHRLKYPVDWRRIKNIVSEDRR